jgi:hypothetical protein
MTVAALTLTGILTLTIDIIDTNFIMPNPTGVMDYLNLCCGVSVSTEAVPSDTGSSSFGKSLHFVRYQVGWFSSRSSVTHLNP